MFSNDQIEELRNYFQVISESGDRLPAVKDIANGTSFYLKKMVNGLITYIKYTVVGGEWYIEQVDEDNNVRHVKA